ncbi:MAG TPA: hypothetical protein DHW61_02035 [Lachnoclostridium phytofermentans]|uniref:TnsA endonuclease N-terminal domain-containing protein n=1 Tax=Lachnoclostridium phytofermentans TaxID=66219 RepID=A0A3D2X3C0_9FIRM|nr:hypothetical protein [Lachnoclostridium phytofermentans]
MGKRLITKLKKGIGSIDLHCPQQYIPWIKTSEFKHSLGTRYTIKDLKNGRLIHLMSGLEKDYYLISRWNDNVVEIFEQYPLLPISDTKRICSELGIRHPFNTKDKIFNVFTTDFLMLVKDDDNKFKWIARSVKPKCELSNKRTLEKLYVESAYWAKMDIEFVVVTEESIDRNMADNIERIRAGFYYDCEPSDEIERIKFLIAQKKIIVDMGIELSFEKIRNEYLGRVDYE